MRRQAPARQGSDYPFDGPAGGHIYLRPPRRDRRCGLLAATGVRFVTPGSTALCSVVTLAGVQVGPKRGPGASATGVERWFLTDGERRNKASDIGRWTLGNNVEPLVDGATYFRSLYDALDRTRAGDQVYFADFRGDTEELLAGPGTSVGEVLADLAGRGVLVFGLIWRSQPGWLDQSEGKNAELARQVSDAGGEVLLDSRTRRAGSHHQKFVVIRYQARQAEDVAFFGGIDLGLSRNDTTQHDGDRQAMEFPAVYGDHPPWHDVQAAVRGPGSRRHRAHLPRAVVREHGAGPVQSGADVDRPRLPRRQAGGSRSARAQSGACRRRTARGAGATDLSGPVAPVPVRAAR